MSKTRSNFWNNFITVLLGATGAHAIPLLVAPLLTRVCTPADMGAFSLWLGVVAVTSIVATLRLEAAMVLDHERQQQRICFGVVSYCAALVSGILTLCMAAAWALGLAVPKGMSWSALLTIGLGTWLTATMQTTLAYAASHNLFKKAAKARVLAAGTVALSQLALLYAGFRGAGLLAGQLIGLAAGLCAMRLLVSPPVPRLKLSFGREERSYLVKHQAFWRYSLPSSLLNTVGGLLPLFMIGLHHGTLAAGLFALTQRVLNAPISLIAASVRDVFKREAVQEFESVGHCNNIYRATFKSLLMLALGPSLVLFLFSPPLFGWAFGEEWRPAGMLARILAPLCFLNFIASPLSFVFFVTGNQRMDLLWQLALFLMTVTVFLAPLSLHQSVLGYAVGRCVLYMVYLYMSHHCSKIGRAAA